MERAGLEADEKRLTYTHFQVQLHTEFLAQNCCQALFRDVTAEQRPVGLHLRGTNHRIGMEESASLQSFVIRDSADTYSWPGARYWAQVREHKVIFSTSNSLRSDSRLHRGSTTTHCRAGDILLVL